MISVANVNSSHDAHYYVYIFAIFKHTYNHMHGGAGNSLNNNHTVSSEPYNTRTRSVYGTKEPRITTLYNT